MPLAESGNVLALKAFHCQRDEDYMAVPLYTAEYGQHPYWGLTEDPSRQTF